MLWKIRTVTRLRRAPDWSGAVGVKGRMRCVTRLRTQGSLHRMWVQVPDSQSPSGWGSSMVAGWYMVTSVLAWSECGCAPAGW